MVKRRRETRSKSLRPWIGSCNVCAWTNNKEIKELKEITVRKHDYDSVVSNHNKTTTVRYICVDVIEILLNKISHYDK